SGGSGLLHQPDEHEQDDRADGGVDDRRDDATADAEAQRGEQPPGDEGADDADDDVADQAEAVALDELSGQPAGDRADDDEDDQTFNAHMQRLLVSDGAIMTGDGRTVQPSPRDFVAAF